MCCKPKSHSCCNSGNKLKRHFHSEEEVKTNLKFYKEDLEKELAGVKEHLQKNK